MTHFGGHILYINLLNKLLGEDCLEGAAKLPFFIELNDISLKPHA
jgi:hypothetical protein